MMDVSLTLGPGQVAVVLGRNGVGKTTLLSAAAGLLPADRGRILDRPHRIGWVPERFPANQPYRIRPYLVEMARLRGLRPAKARAEVDRWAARLQLDRYFDVRLAEVSKGTAQKVGLIQALLAPPDLLVLDEPWEGLDSFTRAEVPAIIREVLAGGGAVLVSDHLGEVQRLPGALRWQVSDGRVSVEEAPPADAALVGSEARSEASGQRWVIEVGTSEADVNVTMARLRDGGYEVLGAHPEPVAANSAGIAAADLDGCVR